MTIRNDAVALHYVDHFTWRLYKTISSGANTVQMSLVSGWNAFYRVSRRSMPKIRCFEFVQCQNQTKKDNKKNPQKNSTLLDKKKRFLSRLGAFDAKNRGLCKCQIQYRGRNYQFIFIIQCSRFTRVTLSTGNLHS